MTLNRHRIGAIVLRHYFAMRRDVENIFETFWWPTLDIFIWGTMSVFIARQSGAGSEIVAFVVGGIYLWMLVYRSQQDISFSFLKEIWDRNFMSIITSPVTVTEYIAASMIVGLLRLTLSAVWLFFLSIALYSFNITVLGLYLIPFAVNLLVVGWWSGLLINSFILRWGYRVQSFAWSLLFIIQPFSAVFYPVTALPPWMQTVARALPTGYIFEGMRQVLAGGRTDPGALIGASVLNAAYLVLSAVMFARAYESARKNGMIVKFS
jgi:ABC-2 type transport system permease protein